MSKKSKLTIISSIVTLLYIVFCETVLFGALNNWKINSWLEVNALIVVGFAWIPVVIFWAYIHIEL